MATNWFEKRMRLNHDVLQNKVINAFVSCPPDEAAKSRLLPYLRLFLAQEAEFKSLLRAGSIDLRLGAWLADQMQGRLNLDSLDSLKTFLDLDFDRTSTLPQRLLDIEELLVSTVAAAKSVLESDGLSPKKFREVESLFRQLSAALSSLPSSMGEVSRTRR